MMSLFCQKLERVDNLRDLIVLYEHSTHYRLIYPKMVSYTLTAISDDKSLSPFNTVALSSGNTDILMNKLGLRKQYYSKISALTNASLITRRIGNYSLTSFGKVVYEAEMLVGKAKQNIWKLKAIDSMESSQEQSCEERCKIIDTLIVDNDLK
jgi:hypothetical protein